MEEVNKDCVAEMPVRSMSILAFLFRRKDKMASLATVGNMLRVWHPNAYLADPKDSAIFADVLVEAGVLKRLKRSYGYIGKREPEPRLKVGDEVEFYFIRPGSTKGKKYKVMGVVRGDLDMIRTLADDGDGIWTPEFYFTEPEVSIKYV